jgi:hypothetical protein
LVVVVVLEMPLLRVAVEEVVVEPQVREVLVPRREVVREEIPPEL